MKRTSNVPPAKKQGQEKAGTISRRTDTTADHDPQSGHQFGGQLSKKVIKAEDQLHLTEEELNVEVDRILEATNPNAPENIVRFNHEDRTFKFEHTVEQAAFHFADDG